MPFKANTLGNTTISAQERASTQIRSRIRSGAYEPGSLLPTERELSQDIGISRPIIRAALFEISESGWITREHGRRPRVARDVAARNGIEKTDSRSDVTPLLKTIAAILPMEPDYPAASNIVRGIQRSLQRLDSSHRLIVFDTLLGMKTRPQDSAMTSKEQELLETVMREGIAGAIYWQSGGQSNLDTLEKLNKSGIPVVFVDRCPEEMACDFVGVDNRVGAREAVSHLIELGHRSIAHLTTFGRGSEGSAKSVRERYEGYRDALEDHGIPFDKDLVIGYTRETVKRIQSTDLAPVTAVFTVNDATAHAFIDLAESEGLRVPDAVSVVGFDDLDRYARRAPFLTTMHVPFEAIGERAAETLMQRLDPGLKRANLVQHTILSTRLIGRTSSRPLMKGDEIGPLAANALNLNA